VGGETLHTDKRGHVTAELPTGRIQATAQHNGEEIPFEFVNAVGLHRARIDIRQEERPIEDPLIVAAMPSGRYVPLRQLGKGAMGTVYQCRDTTLDRLVAIKVMNPELPQIDRADLLEEARGLARVEHPNLIRIHDLGLTDSQAYLVLQYVDGPNLEDLLQVEGPLPAGAVAAAGVQLLLGLSAIHEMGLVHRDIKPSNGLVDRNGVVRLTDFGLVRPMVDFTDPRSKVHGTPAYMSPEQLQGWPLGPASDIYSLGATLYHLATGKLPFADFSSLLAALIEDLPPLGEQVADIPDELSEIVSAMLSKSPDERPDSPTICDVLSPLSTTVPHAEGLNYLPRLPSGNIISLRSQRLGAQTLVDPRFVDKPEESQESATEVAGESPTERTSADVSVEIHSDPAAKRARLKRRALALLVMLNLVIAVGIFLSRSGSDDPPEEDPGTAENLVAPPSEEPLDGPGSDAPPLDRQVLVDDQLDSESVELDPGVVRQNALLEAQGLATERQATAVSLAAALDELERAERRAERRRARADRSRERGERLPEPEPVPEPEPEPEPKPEPEPEPETYVRPPVGF